MSNILESHGKQLAKDPWDSLDHLKKGWLEWPSSSMMGYSPIAKKKSHWSNGENIWGKLMVLFPIRSIYLNGTNYHNFYGLRI